MPDQDPVAALGVGVPPREAELGPGATSKLLRGAFHVADKAIRALADRAQSLRMGEEAAFLDTYVTIAITLTSPSASFVNSGAEEQHAPGAVGSACASRIGLPVRETTALEQ